MSRLPCRILTDANRCNSRLLIAQDHDEIFLCLASYDEGYVKFLTEGDDSTESFLEIQEYG